MADMRQRGVILDRVRAVDNRESSYIIRFDLASQIRALENRTPFAARITEDVIVVSVNRCNVECASSL